MLASILTSNPTGLLAKPTEMPAKDNEFMDVDSDSDISLLAEETSRSKAKGKGKAVAKSKKAKGKGKANEVSQSTDWIFFGSYLSFI